MYRGRLTGSTSEEENCLVIDVETILMIERRFFRKRYYFTDLSSPILDYINKHVEEFTRVVVVTIGNERIVRSVIEKTLRCINIEILDLETEGNYKVWLNITKPKIHMACNSRRNYYRTSTLVDAPYFANLKSK